MVYGAFLDIEKTYDRVNREMLWEILRKRGVPIKWINIIKSMYTNTKAKFTWGNI